MLVTAVVLPIGDILRPGDEDIADGAEAVATVDDLAVAVFQPDVPDGIAPGHRGAPEQDAEQHLDDTGGDEPAPARLDARVGAEVDFVTSTVRCWPI